MLNHKDTSCDVPSASESERALITLPSTSFFLVSLRLFELFGIGSQSFFSYVFFVNSLFKAVFPIAVTFLNATFLALC